MMQWGQWRAYLFPDAEADDGFRRELQRQAHLGLKVIGWVNIWTSLFLNAARFVVAPDPPTVGMRLAEGGAVVGIGVTALLLTRITGMRRHARTAGMALGLLTGTVLVWFSLCMCEMTSNADDFIPGQMTLILLVGIAALPLRPAQTLGFGVALMSAYGISAKLAEAWSLPLAYLQPTYLLFMVTLTFLSTALTAIVYAQRSQSYFRYQQTLRAQQDLQEAQRRMMLAENAASMGRLAAALSHELNSPLGALRSGVDTMVLLNARQSAAPMEPHRFLTLLNDLRKTIQDASARLEQTVSRMQRIANLDRSEVQRVQISALVSDVVSLCEARIGETATLELKLEEVPPIVCRPQQLSAVFRNLLNNSVDAVNGNGRIKIVVRAVDESVEVVFQDNGRGISEEEAQHVFEPNFRVADGRVGTGNWSMFSSRQVIREHGGEIELKSVPGAGTTVRVVLPLQGVSLS